MSIIPVLLTICSILIMLTMLSLSFLVVSKVHSNRREALDMHVQNMYRQAMYEYLVLGRFTASIIPRKRNIQSYEKLLLEYSYIISGLHVTSKIKEYAESYFTEHYKTMLQSKSWGMRVNGLNGILQFKMNSLTENVELLFHQKKNREDNIIAYLIIQIMLINNNNQIINLMKQYDVELSLFQYREMCSKLNDNQWAYLIANFEQLSFVFKSSIFDSIALFKKIDCQQLLENQLVDVLDQQRQLLLQEEKELSGLIDKLPTQDQELIKKYERTREDIIEKLKEINELIVRGLKALSTLGYTANIYAYEKYLSTPFWEEKMMIIRLIGKMRVVNKLEYLVSALSDANYLIRKEAAHSISLLPIEEARLKQLLDNLDDKYAKQMLQEYII